MKQLPTNAMTDDAIAVWKRTCAVAIERGRHLPCAADVLACITATSNLFVAQIIRDSKIDLAGLLASIDPCEDRETYGSAGNSVILAQAHFEARSSGCSFIDTEHILLAALKTSESRKVGCLELAEISLDNAYRTARAAYTRIIGERHPNITIPIETRMRLLWNGMLLILALPTSREKRLEDVAMGVSVTLAAQGAIVWECGSGKRPRMVARYSLQPEAYLESAMKAVCNEKKGCVIPAAQCLLIHEPLGTLTNIWIQVAQRPISNALVIKGNQAYLKRLCAEIDDEFPTGFT